MKEQDLYEYTRKRVEKGVFLFMTYSGLLRKMSCQQLRFSEGKPVFGLAVLSELLSAEQVNERAGQGFYRVFPLFVEDPCCFTY